MYFGKNPLLIVFDMHAKRFRKKYYGYPIYLPSESSQYFTSQYFIGACFVELWWILTPNNLFLICVIYLSLLGNTNIKVAKLNNDFQIPLLNTTHNHLLKEGQLVRFQGMIQDMYNPVYYLATYEVHNTITNEKIIRSGKYKDSLECAVSVLLVILFHLVPQLKWFMEFCLHFWMSELQAHPLN